ncbi:hypothetical protein C8Q73DRAFT_792991 [Cubamyces lactineus]|nr:hypothetical protein C8Q73DRAFT_792991 [Cubamyces lactineus]
MKFFSNVLPVAGLALTLFLGASAQKMTDVVRSIHFVTDSAQSLEQDIKRVNDGDVDNEGKLIGQDIHTFAELIIDQLKTVFYDVDDPMPFGDNNAQLVLDAFQQSVTAEKATFQAIIDKHSFAVQYLLVGGIVQPVRELRAALEAYAGAVISLVPTEEGPAGDAFKDLEDLLEAAVQAYES